MRVSFNEMSLLTVVFAVALSVGAGACGDDEAEDNPGGGINTGTGTVDGGTTPGADGGPTSETPAVPPLYAIVSVPATAAGAPATSYVIVSETLTGELKPENAALEIAGRAVAGGPNGGRALYVGTSESAELTRYALGDDGKLKANGTVNFGAQGLTAFDGYSAAFEFVGPNKAYWFARDGKIVVWNPEELIVTGAIPTPTLVRADPANPATNYTTSFTGAPPVRIGTKLYSFAAWDTRAAGAVKIPPSYAVVVVDTATDTADVVVDEAGCGYGRDAVLVGDWLYIATEAVGSSVHYLNAANGPEPCLRRFNVTTNTFDAAFNVKLNTLAGGAPVGSLAVSPGGKALIHVLDTANEQVKGGQLTNPRVLSSAAVWKTARLTVGDTPSLEILDRPLKSASALPAVLGEGFTVTPTFDTTNTTNPRIYEVTDDGIAGTERANATIPGTTWGIVRLR